MELVELLLERGANVNMAVFTRYKVRETPLTAAISSKNDKLVSYLLERGADPNLYDQDASPLYKACASQRKRLVKLLLQHGADVTRPHRPPPSRSPTCIFGYLKNTRVRGRCGIVRYLLDAGIEVNCTDQRGQTPLMLAAQANNIAVIQLLLDRQASINKADHDGQTALFYAVSYSQVCCLFYFWLYFVNVMLLFLDFIELMSYFFSI